MQHRTHTHIHQGRKSHANLNCKSCLWYYKWGIKVLEKKTFSLSLLSHWSEKELLFLNGSKIRFSIPFWFIQLVLFPFFCYCFFFCLYRNRNERPIKKQPKGSTKKKFQNSKLSLTSTGKVMKRVSNFRFSTGIRMDTRM